jgi:hypothetical protein
MTLEEYLDKLKQDYNSSGTSQPNLWSYAYAQRYNNPDPLLANAEHYLWGLKESQTNPMMGLFGPILAAGYYGGKKLGFLGGRSEPTLEQLLAGSRGYLAGLWE